MYRVYDTDRLACCTELLLTTRLWCEARDLAAAHKASTGRTAYIETHVRSDADKPCLVQSVYDGRGVWHTRIYRAGVLTAQGRGCSERDAVSEAITSERRRMRLERDERARLALGRNVAMAELASLAGCSAPVADIRAATTDPAVHALLDWFTSPRE